MEKLLNEIEAFSAKYEFSFQFWGAGNNNVYIEKDGVDIYNSGGFETIEDVLKDALNYLYRVNRIPLNKRKC